MLDIALWAVPLGIIGARLYHVLTHPDDYFCEGANVWNPFEPGAIWNIWEGGNAIYGSLIGGAIGVSSAAASTGIRFWSFADALAPGLLVAQAVGRLGNWFNHELFGLPTDLPWGLEIDRPTTRRSRPVSPKARCSTRPSSTRSSGTSSAPRSSSSLERQINLPLGQGVRRLPHLVRPRARLLRVDPRRPERDVPRHPRRTSGRRCAAIVLGIVIFLVQRRRHTGDEPSPYVPGREWKGPTLR